VSIVEEEMEDRESREKEMSAPFMNTLKLIFLTIVQWVKQAWLLPQTIAEAVKKRQRQTVFHKNEIERLDRIRNPSKYLGK
jgi:hypothetical protein